MIIRIFLWPSSHLQFIQKLYQHIRISHYCSKKKNSGVEAEEMPTTTTTTTPQQQEEEEVKEEAKHWTEAIWKELNSIAAKQQSIENILSSYDFMSSSYDSNNDGEETTAEVTTTTETTRTYEENNTSSSFKKKKKKKKPTKNENSGCGSIDDRSDPMISIHDSSFTFSSFEENGGGGGGGGGGGEQGRRHTTSTASSASQSKMRNEKNHHNYKVERVEQVENNRKSLSSSLESQKIQTTIVPPQDVYSCHHYDNKKQNDKSTGRTMNRRCSTPCNVERRSNSIENPTMTTQNKSTSMNTISHEVNHIKNHEDKIVESPSLASSRKVATSIMKKINDDCTSESNESSSSLYKVISISSPPSENYHSNHIHKKYDQQESKKRIINMSKEERHIYTDVNHHSKYDDSISSISSYHKKINATGYQQPLSISSTIGGRQSIKSNETWKKYLESISSYNEQEEEEEVESLNSCHNLLSVVERQVYEDDYSEVTMFDLRHHPKEDGGMFCLNTVMNLTFLSLTLISLLYSIVF